MQVWEPSLWHYLEDLPEQPELLAWKKRPRETKYTSPVPLAALPFQISCDFGSSVLGRVPEFYSRQAFWSLGDNRCVFWNESPFLIWMSLGALWLILFCFLFCFVHSIKAAFWGAVGPDRQEHHLVVWSHKLHILMKKTPHQPVMPAAAVFYVLLHVEPVLKVH